MCQEVKGTVSFEGMLAIVPIVLACVSFKTYQTNGKIYTGLRHVSCTITRPDNSFVTAINRDINSPKIPDFPIFPKMSVKNHQFSVPARTGLHVTMPTARAGSAYTSQATSRLSSCEPKPRGVYLHTRRAQLERSILQMLQMLRAFQIFSWTTNTHFFGESSFSRYE